MTFDLLQLFKTEKVTIEVNEKYSLIVTVREIPHGEMVRMQKEMFGTIAMSKNKKDIERQISNIRVSGPEFSDRKNLLGIQSMAVLNGSSEPQDLPVNLETWHNLPHSVTEQIEQAIERLNPEMDEDFQD